VVGVMGISQGARLVAGLLLEREQGQGGARGGGGWLDGVRFGVLLNGTFPAMLPVSVPVPVPELGQGEGGVGGGGGADAACAWLAGSVSGAESGAAGGTF